MKTMKKLMALLLTFAMVMSLSVTVFAAEPENNLTIADGDTHTYAVYQIMVGDLADGKLSNVKWGQNAVKTGAVSEDDLSAVAALTGSDADIAAELAKLVNLNGTAYKTIDAENGAVVADGYYLIKDLGVKQTDGTYSLTDGDAYSLYVIEVVGDVDIQAKKAVPGIDKNIVDNGTAVKVNEASIGERVFYEVVGSMPSNLDAYNEYFFWMKDTMTAGLTYAGDMAITLVNGETEKNITQCFTESIGTVDGSTVLYYSINDLLALNLLEGFTVDKDSKIVFTYSAYLNENAVIAGEGNPNTAQMVYSNDPNNSGEGTPADNPPDTPPDTPPTPPDTPPTPPDTPPTPPTPPTVTGQTPESKTVTFTTKLDLQKIDGAEKAFVAALAGAEFTLVGENTVTAFTTTEKYTADEDGTFYQLKPVEGSTDVTYTDQAPTDETMSLYTSDATYKMETVLTADSGEQSITAVVDENGQITFKGLGAGRYTLTETKTPAGYNTCDPVTFVVTFAFDTETQTATFDVEDNDYVSAANNILSTTIENNAGSVLPSTGGIGTTIFYAVGAVLVIGAGVLLITKKRMGET